LHEQKKMKEINRLCASTGIDGHLQEKRIRCLLTIGGKEQWNSAQIAIRSAERFKLDIGNNNTGWSLE
jgi:hypothetical protein